MQNISKVLSSIIGNVTAIEEPKIIPKLLKGFFLWLYRPNLEECVLVNPSDYKSLSALFSRRLKKEARPFAGSLASPCDGVIRSNGKVVNGKLLQIKGVEYLVNDLIQDNDINLEGWYSWQIYLSPRDYHRVHAPFSCVVNDVKRIPGSLLPVADWSLRLLPKLLITNERIVLKLSSTKGIAYLVMVGATNVGSIILPFAENVPAKVEQGDEIGAFNLGSTVVLITSWDVTPESYLEKWIKCGTPLAK
jgi:phosphatidylserine decarboxylase